MPAQHDRQSKPRRLKLTQTFLTVFHIWTIGKLPMVFDLILQDAAPV